MPPLILARPHTLKAVLLYVALYYVMPASALHARDDVLLGLIILAVLDPHTTASKARTGRPKAPTKC